MPRISVIVPVYKVEDYLDRCVQSILNQSFGDFELILVDDGSPDNCGAMCDAWAQRDSRVHTIHQKNGGLSAARNTGIDWVMTHSNSDWISFIDSDDWIHHDFLQRLLNGALEYGVKVCCCGYAETTGEDPLIEPQNLEPQCWDPGEFYRSRNIDATIACAKLYHKSCFKQTRYPVGKVHEDEFVTYRVLYLHEQIAFIPAPLYAYYINPEGLSKRTWTVRHLDAWEAYEQQIAFFVQRGEEPMVQNRYRAYIENAEAQLRSVALLSDASQRDRYSKRIKKHLRKVLRRAWKLGYIHFWIDFDLLYTCAPIQTRLYRLWLEIKK